MAKSDLINIFPLVPPVWTTISLASIKFNFILAYTYRFRVNYVVYYEEDFHLVIVFLVEFHEKTLPLT